MQIIRPMAVTPENLLSSDVDPTAPDYDVGDTYDKGEIVQSDSKEYESLQDANTGHALTETDWWLLRGADNEWRMFDGALNSQTSNPESITVEIQGEGIVDSFALLNLNAQSVQITLTDAVDGLVFDQTYSLLDNSAVVDWFSYFFEPFRRTTDLTVLGSTLYRNAVVWIQLLEPDGVARIGECVMGQGRTIGQTGMGARLGILDFSRKERDQFGNVEILQRDYSRTGGFDVLIDNATLNATLNLVAELRATPLVWIPAAQYASATIYGFFRDAEVVVAYPNHSLVNLQIEGLV